MSATVAAVAALGLLSAYLLVGFGLRTWLQVRRTGESGFRGISGRPGSAEWTAGVLFVVAIAACLLGPVAALAGLPPIPALVALGAQVGGIVLAVAGLVGTLVSQVAMGTSWRIGVRAGERTGLVTSGPFGVVRNPIFTAMAVTGLGLAMLVPNLVSLAGSALLVLAMQLQVRVVEEPYLVAMHGDTYLRYAARTGRFVPRVGTAVSSAATDTAGPLPGRY
jgi:protein-S-isoprenylcysteine O-methyltransferase Ste14